MKEFIKKILPAKLLISLNNIRFSFLHKQYKSYDNAQIFTKIYKNKLWNKKSNL